MLAWALAALAVLPFIIYGLRQAKASTPRLRWPGLASILKLEYLANPPRMQGLWNGRRVAVETAGDGVRVSAYLTKPSRLRVEIGPRAEVEKRAGLIVPDPVATGDADFEEKYLARCSDKGAGARMIDQTLRRRVLAQERLDLLSQSSMVQATIPAAKDADSLEAVFEILSVVAGEMEACG